MGLEWVLFTRKSTRPDLLAFSKCLLNKLVTICLIPSTQGKSPCETFSISVASMHPKQNLLLTSHVGVEKHWAWSQKIWVEVPPVMCCASKKVYRQIRNNQKYVPCGAEQPGSQASQNTNAANQDYHSEGVNFNLPHNGSFYSILFIFLLFFNGGNLEGPQSRSWVSNSGASLGGIFLGVISLRDICLPSFFPWEEDYIRGVRV